MFESDDSPLGYKKVIRDRASESLGSLRITFNSPVKTPPSASNNRSRHEYNSAVSRLKVLLQQYNNSKLASDPSWLHDVTSRVQSQSSFLPDADELTELLNSQYVVIQHLENQVEFYKDALGTLRKRTELITQENQSLYEQLKTRTVNELVSKAQETHIERPASSQTPAMDSTSGKDKGHVRFDISEEESEEGLPSPRIHDYYPPPHSNTGSYPPHPGEHPGDQYSLGSAGVMSSATGSDDQLFLSSKERQFVSQMQAEVDKIRELHEAKSRHLETLLYSTRDELEDYQRQVTQLQEKIRDQAGILEQGGKSVLCLKCGTQEAVLASSDATAKTISKITRERDELMDVLTKQKSSVSEVRKRELDAYTQVKKSCELVEQAQLEKAQAIIQVQQLKEELKKQGERHEQYARESCNRAGQELEKAKSRLVEDIDQLNKKSMSDAQAATENQLDRVTREKVAIATELEQAKAQIMSHSAEVAKMGEEMQKELNKATIKTTLAEQQVASLKTAVQQASRQREQERVRQQTESSELRRRLEEAESGWMESKEECIRLTERLDHATREVRVAHEQVTSKVRITHKQVTREVRITHKQATREVRITHEQVTREVRITHEQVTREVQITYEQVTRGVRITHDHATREVWITYEQATREIPLAHEPATREERITHDHARREIGIVHGHTTREVRVAHEEATREVRITHEPATREDRITHDHARREIGIVHDHTTREVRVAHEEATREVRVAHEQATREVRITHEQATREVRVAHEQERIAYDHGTREAKISATAKKNLEKARAAELTAVNQQATQREQQLTTLLQETENRNMQARVELEQMLESQMNVVARLKAECQRLTQQLNDLSIKSRKELRDSVTERDRIQAQLSSVKSKGKELEANLKKKDQLVENLNNKLKRSETDVKTNITQIYDLLVKQNSLLRDRQALTREVEYLRQQLLQSRTQDCVTPADTESNASTIDNQDA
ncbi:predicted protein [Nematostella vectensis]|uniref:Serologically defined colon cancer antigen 8 homolog n=1 Tax=Nematostella vectensis TaxID=45351 RepID=A7S4V5_NEMVE|nr:predicted protein [Nematostella vectensis]|eukprot:XP_001633325.1 predicted protein [Nematostella vectensis]